MEPCRKGEPTICNLFLRKIKNCCWATCTTSRLIGSKWKLKWDDMDNCGWCVLK
jgi:hypothetical protein